jgi:hypothetical protein
MKTLAALKRQAKDFKWSMTETNSFFFRGGIPDFLKAYRKVTKVQADRLAFETNKNGEKAESWVTFPKAKQVAIEQSNDAYIVTFTQDTGTFIKYHLVKAKP